MLKKLITNFVCNFHIEIMVHTDYILIGFSSSLQTYYVFT